MRAINGNPTKYVTPGAILWRMWYYTEEMLNNKR